MNLDDFRSEVFRSPNKETNGPLPNEEAVWQAIINAVAANQDEDPRARLYNLVDTLGASPGA
jgi:hypothetical protein